MLRLIGKGDHRKTGNRLKRLVKGSQGDVPIDLDSYGRMGKDALSEATPVDSGVTASSWNYAITKDSKGPGIVWNNDNIASNGTPVVILIQYGHGTGTGGYVAGIDFINPAMTPIFDQLIDDLWKEVSS